MKTSSSTTGAVANDAQNPKQTTKAALRSLARNLRSDMRRGYFNSILRDEDGTYRVEVHTGESFPGSEEIETLDLRDPEQRMPFIYEIADALSEAEIEVEILCKSFVGLGDCNYRIIDLDADSVAMQRSERGSKFETIGTLSSEDYNSWLDETPDDLNQRPEIFEALCQKLAAEFGEEGF